MHVDDDIRNLICSAFMGRQLAQAHALVAPLQPRARRHAAKIKCWSLERIFLHSNIQKLLKTHMLVGWWLLWDMTVF